MPVRLVVAHRSALIRDVLRIIGASRDVLVVGEAAGPTELCALCAAERPDVVLAEASFGDGTDIADRLPELLGTGARVGVVCDDASPERVTRTLAAGASGWLRSDSTPADVIEAVAVLARGSVVLEPAAAGTILEQWRGLRGGPGAAPTTGTGQALTARERDVLAAMADGLRAKAIARLLGVAPKTVEHHKTRVFDKLGVRTQAAAVSVAIAHGLLEPPTTVAARSTAPQSTAHSAAARSTVAEPAEAPEPAGAR